MDDKPSGEHGRFGLSGSVLRPFEARPQPPLPPIEPSKVVPEPPAAIQPEVAEPEVAEAAAVEPEVAEADAVEPEVDEPDAHPTATTVENGEPLPDHAEPTGEPLADGPELAVGGALAGELPDATPIDDTITIRRLPFLVGLGVLMVALLALVVLWQTAGDDSAAVVSSSTTSLGVEDGPAPTLDTTELDAEIAGLSEDLAASQSAVEGLEAEVSQLEGRPAPALPGAQLRRIVVGADAAFVSAAPDSVTVVGAFGGLSLIDPETNRVSANATVAGAASRMTRTSSSIWLTDYTDSQILRVDAATNTVAATFPFVGPDGIDKDGNTIVVASFDGGFVARVDPNTGALLQVVDVGGSPTAVFSHPDFGLWAAISDTGEIVEIDRDSFEVVQRVVVGAGPVAIGAGSAYLWVTNAAEGTIAKVDPTTGEVVLTVGVGAGPTESVVADGSVWVTVTDEGSLVQVDAASGDIVTRTPLGGSSAGGGPAGISYGTSALWIAMEGELSVVRIDL